MKPHSLYVLDSNKGVSSSEVSCSYSDSGNAIEVNGFVKVISGNYKGYCAVVLKKIMVLKSATFVNPSVHMF